MSEKATLHCAFSMRNGVKMEPLEIPEKCEVENKFNCIDCKFTTNNKTNFGVHLKTVKHKKRENINALSSSPLHVDTINKYTCFCGKLYKHSQGLSKHKKICNIYKNKKEMGDAGDNQLILSLAKQNQEFKDIIMKQQKIIMELAQKN
jgi:hypothetical protein